MSYESQEERLERLESQVTVLIQMVKILADFGGTTAIRNAKIFNGMVSFDLAILQSNLTSFKVVYENSSGFTEPFRQAMLVQISEIEKMFVPLQSELAELIKSLPVLPEDLFGSDQKWPPQNPPDNPPGS